MGALTDNRKRCFVDLCFPSLPLSFDLVDDTPPSKKPKFLASSGSVPPSDKQKVVPFPIQLPPPFRRRVQGPQRTIRVFGLGKGGESKPEPEAREPESPMGNLLSRVAKKVKYCSGFGSRKGKSFVEDGKDGTLDDGLAEELDLEDYKRLVEVAQEGNLRDVDGCLTGSRKFVYPGDPVAAVSDLRVLTREEEETPRAHVFNRKVEDERVVEVELTPGNNEVRWTKRTPLYKDLLEETSRKYDTKLSNLEFEVKLAEERISQFHIPQDEEPEEELGPFAPLTEEEENDVTLALRSPSKSLRSNDVLIIHEASNIEITREIIQCLRHGAWLNDEVINLYFELLKEREQREPEKFLKCYFFNTFFYKKLTSGRDRYDFKAVRRWTTQRKIGYSLIECDKIFVPIHKEIHWCLAVINVKDQTLQYLDSLGGMDDEVLTVLARYLTDEAKDKSNMVLHVSSWKQESVTGLPLQKNGWDCGMFMLKYIDFYSRGLGLNFGQSNMSYFRKRTVKELLNLRAE